jgi:hypothetical protein
VWGGPAGGRARWSRRNGLFVGVEWSDLVPSTRERAVWARKQRAKLAWWAV